MYIRNKGIGVSIERGSFSQGLVQKGGGERGRISQVGREGYHANKRQRGTAWSGQSS